MSQRAFTLTFKSSDASTHTLSVPVNASVTAADVIQHVRSRSGFWSGETWNGGIDETGVSIGSVWVAWEQVVLVTTS